MEVRQDALEGWTEYTDGGSKTVHYLVRDGHTIGHAEFLNHNVLNKKMRFTPAGRIGEAAKPYIVCSGRLVFDASNVPSYTIVNGVENIRG